MTSLWHDFSQMKTQVGKFNVQPIMNNMKVANWQISLIHQTKSCQSVLVHDSVQILSNKSLSSPVDKMSSTSIVCIYAPCYVVHYFCQVTQQKAVQPHLSTNWSFSVIESAKTNWNSVVCSVTSALVNEQNQWDRLTSVMTDQVKRLGKYFESPPKEKSSSKE